MADPIRFSERRDPAARESACRGADFLTSAGSLLVLAAFVLASAAADAACLNPDPQRAVASSAGEGGDGIGGTGFDPEPDGIGGTGLRDMSADQLDRIRAAGRVPVRDEFDVAIRGTLTGFGSLCVNGLSIRLPEEAVIESEGRHIDPEWLRIGELVSIEARSVSGSLRARHVSLRPTLAGRVQEVMPSDSRLTLLGRVIELARDALVEDEETGESVGLLSIQPGDFVVVHGLRASDGRLLASYIVRSALPAQAFVRGVVQRREDQWWVGGVRVEPLAVDSTWVGHWIVARGDWSGALRRLERARLDPSPALAPGARHVFVEALVRHTPDGTEISSAGLEIATSQHARRLIDSLAPDTRLWLGGQRRADGRIDVSLFRIAPEHVLSQLVDRRSAPAQGTAFVDLLPGAQPLDEADDSRTDASSLPEPGPWSRSPLQSARPGLIPH